MNTYPISQELKRIADALEDELKVDRSLIIEEHVVILARKVCLELGINHKMGSPRNDTGWRLIGRKIIWFTDRVQKERFMEALSMLEEDPKAVEEENVFTSVERYTVVEPDGK